MCRPIRSLTEAKGHDASQHVLACFGGAGAQHACAIARSLGMRTVFIHRFAGILSAYGLGLADVVNESQVQFFFRIVYFVGTMCDSVWKGNHVHCKNQN